MNSTDATRIDRMSRDDFRISAAQQINALTTESVSRKASRKISSSRSTNPQPTQTRAPQPTQTRAPQPTQTRAPQPTQTRAPQPTQTRAPQPTQTRAPQPTQARASQPAAQDIPRRPQRPQLPPAEIILKKGEKYSLTKNNPLSTNLRVGIGWDFSSAVDYDIDIEAFILNEREVVPDDSWIVFYGQLKSPDNAVIHRGDSSNGANFGADCEQIDVNLSLIDKGISKIAFVVTINEAKLHGYNFSGIKNAHIRISDVKTGKEIVRYQLTDYYKEVVSMVVGELYLRNGEWRFNPVGMGTGDDLEGLCNRYGIEVK